jgi:pimeloyl-ACP methyl ester carboxylesterase
MSQLRKSWYIFFFQLPWLPEAAVSGNDWALGTRALIGSSRPGAFSEQDLARYRAAWSQPQAMTSMLNWYRAMLQRSPHMPPDARIHVPTLLLWGEQDQFLESCMAQLSADLCDDARLILLPNVTHWIMQEEPTLVTDKLAAHFV